MFPSVSSDPSIIIHNGIILEILMLPRRVSCTSILRKFKQFISAWTQRGQRHYPEEILLKYFRLPRFATLAAAAPASLSTAATSWAVWYFGISLMPAVTQALTSTAASSWEGRDMTKTVCLQRPKHHYISDNCNNVRMCVISIVSQTETDIE